MMQIKNYKIIPVGRSKDLSNQQFGDYRVLYRTEVPSTFVVPITCPIFV